MSASPDPLDALTAAPDTHGLLFENDNVPPAAHARNVGDADIRVIGVEVKETA